MSAGGSALEKLLSQNRDKILREWTDCLFRTYSPEMARFLRRERDPFANPVGAAVRSSLGPVFDGLLAGDPADEIAQHLDQLVQIRCVQDFSPSEALAFLLEVKRIVREVAGGTNLPDVADFLDAFDRRVEALVLRVFDTFVKYRDRTWEVRIREVKRRVSALARMSRLSDQDLDPGPAPAAATD